MAARTWQTRARSRAQNGAVVAAFVALAILAYRSMTNDLVRWLVFPGILVIIAGALGGAAFSVTPLRRLGGWRKTAADAMSILLYCVIVCAAFVAALARPG